MSIRLILEPSVYLVGQSEVNPDGLGRFLADHDLVKWSTDTEVGGEVLIEVAGRCSYLSFSKPRPGGNRAYIGHLLESAHGSVCEHAVFNLIITGVSRSLTHELVRHRAGWAYSQLSQRYVDESDVAFVMPPAIRSSHPEIREYWVESMAHCLERYRWLVAYLDRQLNLIEDRTERRKAVREAARSVLPNATETKIFVTANARALRHFIELRAHPAADAEIRRLAVAVWTVLRDAAPALFSDYRLTDLPDGSQSLSTPHRKV